MACHLSINFKTWTGMKDAAGAREITRPALTGYQDFVKTTQSGMCGSHSGAEQWKCLQPVLEDYCISHKVGYITGDNHCSNDVLCRILSQFLREQGIPWDAKHQQIRCHGHIINLCVHAFLFMDNTEAVLEACKQIEEIDEASFNMDILEGWTK
jgi:hypothetical protein